MKIINIILILALSVFLVAGCSSEQVEAPPNDDVGEDNGSDPVELTGPIPEDFAGKNVVILVYSYFTAPNQGINQYEFEALYHGFKTRTHATVTVATSANMGVEGLEDRDGNPVEVQDLLAMNPEAFDAIFVVGGGGTRDYWDCEKTMNYLREFAQLGRPLGGVCSGVTLVTATGLLEGLEVTTDEFYKAQVEGDGAIYLARPNAVNDGQFWTIKGGAETLFFRNFLPEFAEME